MYFLKSFSHSLNFLILAMFCVFVANNSMARSAPDSFADLAQKLLPAVVNISTTSVTKKATGKTPEMPQFPLGLLLKNFSKSFLTKTDQSNNESPLP
ncbi:MAG: hypothetical protein ACJZ9G_07585 [Rhodospirillales bacterium]